jgi:hypothetical protein
MEMNSLYQICIFFTISLTVFTSCVSFVSGLNLFGPVDAPSGFDEMNSTNSSIHRYTKSESYPSGFGTSDLFALTLGGGTIAAILGTIGIAYFTGSTTYVGIYLFSVYFWTTYTTAFGIISIIGLPLSFILIFTGAIVFIFIGAVIGMLSGV